MAHDPYVKQNRFAVGDMVDYLPLECPATIIDLKIEHHRVSAYWIEFYDEDGRDIQTWARPSQIRNQRL